MHLNSRAAGGGSTPSRARQRWVRHYIARQWLIQGHRRWICHFRPCYRHTPLSQAGHWVDPPPPSSYVVVVDGRVVIITVDVAVASWACQLPLATSHLLQPVAANRACSRRWCHRTSSLPASADATERRALLAITEWPGGWTERDGDRSPGRGVREIEWGRA